MQTHKSKENKRFSCSSVHLFKQVRGIKASHEIVSMKIITELSWNQRNDSTYGKTYSPRVKRLTHCLRRIPIKYFAIYFASAIVNKLNIRNVLLHYGIACGAHKFMWIQIVDAFHFAVHLSWDASWMWCDCVRVCEFVLTRSSKMEF